MFYGTASLIRDLSLEMPADEKARSGLMFAGGISRKLEKFCEKPLLPPPENTEISFLIIDAISWGSGRCVSSSHCVADSNLKLLCECQRRSLLNVPFVFGFRLLKTDVAQQFQVVQK